MVIKCLTLHDVSQGVNINETVTNITEPGPDLVTGDWSTLAALIKRAVILVQ